MRLDERGSADIPMVGVDVSSLSPRDDPGTQLSRNLRDVLKVGVVMQDHRAVMLGHGSTGGLRPEGGTVEQESCGVCAVMDTAAARERVIFILNGVGGDGNR